MAQKRQLSLKTRSVLTLSALFLIGALVGGFWIYRHTSDILIEGKQQGVNSIVFGTMNILDYNYRLFKEGKINEDEAKKHSKESLRALRFGPDKDDYLFIYDKNGICLLLPPKPEKEGQDLSGLKDSKGVPIIQNVIDSAANNGRFFYYLWPDKKNKERFVTKMSMALRFEPWGWNLGTGIYINETESEAKEKALSAILIIALASAFMVIGISFFLSRRVIDPVIAIAKDIQAVSNEVNDKASALTQTSKGLADSSAEQASAVEETAASLEELTKMVETNTSHSQSTAEIATRAKKLSDDSTKSINQMKSSMAEILKGNEEIQNLVTVIQSIAEKTKIMDEIVFQTKLLSFNASVEAERAGEHGRGFAVVAQEVGNLAQLSGNAAQEIAKIVSGSIVTVQQITVANEARVKKGSEQLQVTSNQIEEIISDIGTIDKNARDIAEASQEQSKGIAQINEAISNIDQAIQSNASLSEKTSDASSKLLEQSTILEGTVSKLKETVLGTA